MTTALHFLFFAALGFAAIEFGSAWLHRHLFHGILWRIHETHHRAPRGVHLEWNDLFAMVFGGIPMALMMMAPSVTDSAQFAFGAGMTFYGAIYFVIHDLMVHRRWGAIEPRGTWIKRVVQGHRVHHQTTKPEGQGPFGLLYLGDWKRN